MEFIVYVVGDALGLEQVADAIMRLPQPPVPANVKLWADFESTRVGFQTCPAANPTAHAASSIVSSAIGWEASAILFNGDPYGENKAWLEELASKAMAQDMFVILPVRFGNMADTPWRIAFMHRHIGGIFTPMCLSPQPAPVNPCDDDSEATRYRESTGEELFC